MASSKYAAHKATVQILKTILKYEKLDHKRLKTAIPIKNCYQLMNYLRKNEYVEKFETNDGSFYKLTTKGEIKLKKIEIDSLTLSKIGGWDGKWRIVCFDIPEKHKLARRLLSGKLKDLGFIQIQKSVYVCPYDCHDEVEAIRCHYDIRKYVFLFTTDNFEGSENLKNIFEL